ncbi:MAG: glycerophosphodiester phosphodiesterase [Chloroflexota bacterium]
MPQAVRLGIGLISILVILANVVAVVVLVTFESEAAGYTSGGDPVQFYEQVQVDLLEDYMEVFGAAHNSGNTISAAVKALAYDADIIEIDVVLVGGQLHAAHWSPFRFFGDRFFRGPTLAEVWGAAAQAEVIKLDLKRPSAEMVDKLLAFLADERRARSEIIVVSDKPEFLATFSERQSQIIRMLSVSDSSDLHDSHDDQELLRIIDGVSVDHALLSADSVWLLKEKGLIVFAWTVNDPLRMNELVEYGVDGIVTDNLAIMQLLGAQQRGETSLRNLAKH